MLVANSRRCSTTVHAPLEREFVEVKNNPLQLPCVHYKKGTDGPIQGLKPRFNLKCPLNIQVVLIIF